MSEKQYNVLVLCTGNSARSILGEVLFNTLGKGKFKAYSAGSKPAGRVNPDAIELLQEKGISTEGLRSKSWDEFAAPGAPEIDFIFTVCDNAAGEACPIWPGKPATAHWGIPDPAHVEGDEARRAAFKKAYDQLARRIQLFMALPIEKLDKLVLKEKLAEIGRIQDYKENVMAKVHVFDPALCCSTGVCGTEVDQALVDFSADVDWLKRAGGQIERFNLAQQPMAFVESAVAKAFLERSGAEALPLILVDGEIALAGRYPTRKELAKFAGVSEQPAEAAPATTGGCCSGKKCC